jgi:hypothetical protein
MVFFTIPSCKVYIDFFGLSKKFAEIDANLCLPSYSLNALNKFHVAISPQERNFSTVSYPLNFIPSISIGATFDLVFISP